MDELTRAAHRARAGDRQALDRFVRASYQDVWRFCALMLDEGAADDLAQETYLQAIRALGRFRGDASARTWILAIARRVCTDELRARYRRTRRDRELGAAARGLTAGDRSGEVALYELLSHLDPGRRAAFMLTQLFRLSYEEAAAVCDCPSGTIRSRVARARADLIELIDPGEAQRQLP
jgi:RNA polymerase sigma-70 factor (ECF subfamily)